MLRGSGGREVVLNPILLAEVLKAAIDEFSTIVTPYTTDLGLLLVLNDSNSGGWEKNWKC